MPEFSSFPIPQGISFYGASSGIKKGGDLDLGAILIPQGAHWLAVTTRNSLKAAPIRHLERLRKKGKPLKAILVNSGNANACTGKKGKESLKRILASLKDHLRSMGYSADEDEIAMASTGVIGVPIPEEKIIGAWNALFTPYTDPLEGLERFSRAILTTDRYPKVSFRKLSLPGIPSSRGTILGIAKGAGMIAPEMATMLAFILTDLDPPLPVLRRIFRRALDESFHEITVDGEMSTNDLVLLCTPLRNPSPWQKSWEHPFFEGLRDVMRELALQIVKDGEGARTLIEIVVEGARGRKEARILALRVANSILVKTAIHGRDPNWGRIAASLGSTKIPIQEKNLVIAIGDVILLNRGEPQGPEAEEKARALLDRDHVLLSIQVGNGPGKARFFTCDLGVPYVRLNASYRS